MGISVALLWLISYGAPIGLAEARVDAMRGPWGAASWDDARVGKVANTKRGKTSLSYPALVFDYYVRLFQRYISPVDGDRCGFYPSCSQYSRLAFSRHGAMWGFMMTADRLMRENGSIWKYHSLITRYRRLYYYDPVEANDFWLTHPQGP